VQLEGNEGECYLEWLEGSGIDWGCPGNCSNLPVKESAK